MVKTFIPTTTPATSVNNSKSDIDDYIDALDAVIEDTDFQALEQALQEHYNSMSELELAQESLQRSLDRMEQLKTMDVPECIIEFEEELIAKRKAKVEYLKNKDSIFKITKKK